MESQALKDLVQRVSQAMQEGDLAGALDSVRELETANRSDPSLARQRAEIARMMGDQDEEVDALILAEELYAQDGQVIEAIEACQQILAIHPEHAEIQERLELLYLADTGSPVEVGPRPEAFAEPAAGADDSSQGELVLTRVVPEDDEHACEEAPSPGQAGAASPEHKLAATPLFGTLDSDSLRRIIASAETFELSESEVVFEQGDAPDALYVVLQGAVVAIAEGTPRKKLAVLEEGAFFGEIGVITNQPCNATIEALVDARLLAIDRAVIWDLMRSEPQFLKVMLRFLRERVIDRLARTGSLFANFTAEELSAVTRKFRLMEVRTGSVQIEQDRESRGLFIVLSGQLRVIFMDNDGDKELARLSSGEIFGEKSLLEGGPASAAVVASGTCWVLCLPREDFDELAEKHPELVKTLEELAHSRDRENRWALRDASGLRSDKLGLR